MDAILGLIVEYKGICIGISIFLVLALIGALADRSASKRFALNTEKMRTNVDKNAVDEANKTAGDAPEVTNTNIATGNQFTTSPVGDKSAGKKVLEEPTVPESTEPVQTPKENSVPAAPTVDASTTVEVPAAPAQDLGQQSK